MPITIAHTCWQEIARMQIYIVVSMMQHGLFFYESDILPQHTVLDLSNTAKTIEI